MKLFQTIKNLFTPVLINENQSFSHELMPRENFSVVNYLPDIAEYVFNGDKFPGSFGITKDYTFVDYYTLRKRSVQLFKENPYCDGLIKKLLRNEIADGLKLQASPVDEILKLDPEKAQKWADEVETHWNLYCNDELICDYKKSKTLPEKHSDARRTALISGDCVCVLRVDAKTGLPSIEIIDGSNVVTPLNAGDYKNKIIHGVEIDDKGRHVAYHITNNNLESVRIPCWGEKSGRRISWMIYGSTERLLDDVRGEPILAKMFYNLKELDRYRDAEQRAATLNAIIPLIVTRSSDGFSGSGFQYGATRRTQETGDTNAVNGDANANTLNVSGYNPGFVVMANSGEKFESFNTVRPNINFGKFEEIIFNLFCMILEIPPEVGKLVFGSSYSASRQARNEFNLYIDFRAKQNGREFLKPIYEEWVVAMSSRRIIANESLVQAWLRNDWIIYNSWLNAEWLGKICPSVDILNDTKAAIDLINNNLSTADTQTRKLVNMSFSTVLKKRKREVDMMKKFELENVEQKTNSIPQRETQEQVENLEQRLSEIMEMISELKK